MALAAAFTIILCTFSLLGAHWGLGEHLWRLSPSLNIPIFLHKSKRITQCLYGCYLNYATAITLTKCSIIVSYLRIFPNPSFQHLVHCTCILVVLMWICSISLSSSNASRFKLPGYVSATNSKASLIVKLHSSMQVMLTPKI